MANVKITLSDIKKINNSNIYTDVDVSSSFIENTLTDRKAIENSINNLLKWRPRERIMNPGFGNTLWRRIFDNFSNFSKSDIMDEVRAILSKEPRIHIEELNVDANIQASEIYVSFTYTIPDFDTYKDGKTVSSYTLTISNS